MVFTNKSLVAILAVGSVIILGVVDPAGAATKRKAWNGQVCTIVGTPGNDRIKGTAKNDVICGLGGNDTISGLGGNDVIDGGAGNDVIDGGAGNDVIDGGAGNDKLSGSAGNDTLIGAAGNDVVNGGAGVDTASFADVTNPGMGLSIDLSAQAAQGDGSDKLIGDENAVGGAGNDTIAGDGSANTLVGGAGHDTITGGAGNDALDGGSGDDNLNGGPGINPCRGNGSTFDQGDVFDVSSCEDVTPPQVVSIVTTPDHVDTRSADQPYKIVIRVRDDLSGFSFCGKGGSSFPTPIMFVDLHSRYTWTNYLQDPYQRNSPQGPGFPIAPGTDTSRECNTINGAIAADDRPVINSFTPDNRLLDVTLTFTGTLPRFSKFGPWDVQAIPADLTSNRPTFTVSNEHDSSVPGLVNFQ